MGVFVALAIQLPALKRNGIRIRPRINLRDPALRETLGIGVPAVFVMLCSFAVVSVQNAAAYSFASNGPSILLYARQWFTLPYAFFGRAHHHRHVHRAGRHASREQHGRREARHHRGTRTRSCSS